MKLITCNPVYHVCCHLITCEISIIEEVLSKVGISKINISLSEKVAYRMFGKSRSLSTSYLDNMQSSSSCLVAKHFFAYHYLSTVVTVQIIFCYQQELIYFYC